MSPYLALSPSDLLALATICLCAGVVRGFSGFALSAVVMAIGVLILPPIELFPILWFQEATASLLMVRGGWAEADRRVVTGLVVGSAVGLPLGLSFTQAVPEDVSKLAALVVIISLAVMQLARIRLAFLATRPGLWGAGVLAGMATGIGNVGGMVVALYVLAQDAQPRVMRASLVLFLAVSMMVSIFTLLLMDVMTGTGAMRGLALAPASALGVVLGKALFRPEWERFYRPFCLSLLIILALVALLRLLVL